MVPERIRPYSKKVFYHLYEWAERHFGKNSMVPPQSMIFIGNGEFLRIGYEFLDYFKSWADLQPNAKVLDIGCGIGRMAIPLTEYLDPEQNAEYHGFDIVEKGIYWCQKRISSRFPHFHFFHSNVYNKYYNTTAQVQASEYRFPFEDAYFDFEFLTSVFTHMFTKDVDHYLSEIARTLKPGGICMATCFILNEESKDLIAQGQSSQAFVHSLDGCMTISLEVPESAIAFELEMLQELISKNGLEIHGDIHFGNWCGRDLACSYQDILVLRKK